MHVPILIGAMLLALMPVCAHAQIGRGVRPEVAEGEVTAILLAKDVNGQRWSMRLGLVGDTLGRITGIITDPQNAFVEPMFAQCETIDVVDTGDADTSTFIFHCQVGPKCPSREPGSCQAWQEVGTVSVPGSFFLPPR